MLVQNRFWATAQIVYKKKIVLQDNAMYCNREVAGLGERCIAIHLVRLEIVLQKGFVLQACRLRDCIAIHQGVLQVERGLGREVYCSLGEQWVYCIARRLLYCDIKRAGC